MAKTQNSLTTETAYQRAAARCATTEYAPNYWMDKFTAGGLSRGEAESIVKRLKEEGFIDEARFAKAFAHDKSAYNHWGPLKIKQALAAKGIDATLAEEALSILPEEDWNDTLEHLLRQKARTLKAASAYERRMKLARFAAGRGFAPGEIFHTLDKLGLQDEE